MQPSNTFGEILKETRQPHVIRQPILKKLGEHFDGKAFVSFFISFNKQIPLLPADADMLEEVLINTDCSKGVVLMIDAPGGDGLTAERIIKICRKYSGDGFEVVVPNRAKSAATMICLGADKIWMGSAAELGPIDPQVVWDFGTGRQWAAAHTIIKTYDNLIAQAIALDGGNIEPLLQQLSRFNAADIERLRSTSNLAEDIAVSSLKSGMMKRVAPQKIRDRIQPFIDPERTHAHGRGIYIEQAKKAGLTIEEIPTKDPLWALVWGLYQRNAYMVNSTPVSKILETENHSFVLNEIGA